MIYVFRLRCDFDASAPYHSVDPSSHFWMPAHPFHSVEPVSCRLRTFARQRFWSSECWTLHYIVSWIAADIWWSSFCPLVRIPKRLIDLRVWHVHMERSKGSKIEAILKCFRGEGDRILAYIQDFICWEVSAFRSALHPMPSHSLSQECWTR